MDCDATMTRGEEKSSPCFDQMRLARMALIVAVVVCGVVVYHVAAGCVVRGLSEGMGYLHCRDHSVMTIIVTIHCTISIKIHQHTQDES